MGVYLVVLAGAAAVLLSSEKKKTVLLCSAYVCVPEQALTKEFKEKVSKGKCCVMRCQSMHVASPITLFTDVRSTP